MSMYKQFKTDDSLEQKGVEIDYGDFVVTIARAGGANKKFARVLEKKTKPFRRAIQTETMDPNQAEEILRETYAEAVVLNWQSKVGEDENGERILEVGIEAPDGGDLLPLTEENVVKTLRNLPDLFIDLQQQAGKVALFRQDVLETDAGN